MRLWNSIQNSFSLSKTNVLLYRRRLYRSWHLCTEVDCTDILYVPKVTIPKKHVPKVYVPKLSCTESDLPKEPVWCGCRWGAYWRHLVNTIEPSVCDSDVKLLFTVTVACCLVLFRSDADPDVLAKYVMALVKKDKPVNELISTCQAQLDIFLQKSKHISFCYHVCVMTDVHFWWSVHC